MVVGPRSQARVDLASYAVDDVFVTNGSPSVTYAMRDDRIEGDIAARLAAKQKIVAVSGPSKAGKTVLVRRVVLEALGWQMAEVSGNDLTSIDDFWLTLAAQTGVASAIDLTAQAGVEVKGGVTAEAGFAPVAKVQGRLDSAFSETNATRTGATIDVRRAVRERLAGMDVCVVIDDFHYAPEEVRRRLARSLKDLSSRQIPIVLIAVPHRVLDLVQTEEELLGRVVRMRVAHWSPLELLRIAVLGFTAMNVNDRKGAIADRLVAESFGSPLLMQELCGEICRRNRVLETQTQTWELQPPPSWADFFARVASNLEHPLAQTLRAGPQERKRRKQRQLRGVDVEVDTYGAVLLGLRDRLPETSVTLTELTDAVNGHLEQRLQLQEIRRVCREMRKKAEAHRRGGDAPIDFSDVAPERMTIADPYLAFYIAWGLESLGLPTDGEQPKF